MNFYVVHYDGSIELRVRAEGAGGMKGDSITDVRPGETFAGYTYEELRDMGAGLVNIEPKG